MKLSATRLTTYLQCPRKYRYRYLDEVPIVPGIALVFGQVMHQILFLLHRKAHEEQAPLDVEFAVSQFDLLWQEALGKEQPRFKTPAEVQQYWDLADDLLRMYVEDQQNSPPPLRLEFAFDLL